MNSLRLVLLPLSLVYWVGATVRNWLFDIGLLKVSQLDVPVISIGNISAGGSGKTPFAEFVVNRLRSRGHHPAVVSRGYGRKSKGYLLVSDGKGGRVDARQGGDEPALLADRLHGIPVAVGEKRVEASQAVVRATRADCVVLDDGFQHRAIHRDLDIVLVTAGGACSRRWLLPAGNWRETAGALNRADVVVISKCRDQDEYARALHGLGEQKTVRTSAFRYVTAMVRRVPSGEIVDEAAVGKSRVMIAAGLGDFASFRDSVTQLGCAVEGSYEFPDHHWYTESDLGRMKEGFRSHQADLLVTTGKDYVRMQSLGTPFTKFVDDVRTAVLDVELRFIVGEEVVNEMIDRVFS